MSQMSDIISQNGMQGKRKPKYSISLTLITLPFIIFIFLFSYLPLFGWVYAFFDYSPGMKLYQMNFVGLKYFAMAFVDSSSHLGQVMVNTFVLSLLGLLIQPLAVLFAIFLSEAGNLNFKKLVQTFTTLPYFISWIIIFSVAYALFSTDSGVINNLLMKFHIIKEPFAFTANSDIAWIFQTILRIWKDLGFSAIVYFAAIAGIDSELYDAASVDGAGRFRNIWHITVPGVLPTFFVLLLLAISNILNNGFEQFYVFNNAMVADKLNVLDFYMYKVGLAMGNYSFSTALGVFKTFAGITLLFGANFIAKKVRGVSML